MRIFRYSLRPCSFVDRMLQVEGMRRR